MTHNDGNSPAVRLAKLGKLPQPGRCRGAIDADDPRSIRPQLSAGGETQDKPWPRRRVAGFTDYRGRQTPLERTALGPFLGLCSVEEFSHVADEQVGCLEGGEVPSPVEAIPADHVMVAFGESPHSRVPGKTATAVGTSDRGTVRSQLDAASMCMFPDDPPP